MKNRYKILLSLCIGVFIADLGSTYIALSVGAQEMNLLFNDLLDIVGSYAYPISFILLMIPLMTVYWGYTVFMNYLPQRYHIFLECGYCILFLSFLLIRVDPVHNNLSNYINLTRL